VGYGKNNLGSTKKDAMKKTEISASPTTPIVYISPYALPIIDELKEFMWFNGFKNIMEMTRLSGQELLQMEGFGYRCLISYMNLLDKYGCGNLFRETKDCQPQ
jgi:hypothetical protein